MERLHALFVVQNGLADAEVLGGDLQQFIVAKELQALLKAHLAGRHKAQRLIAAAGAHIGLLLALADVHRHVLQLGADAHHHTGVDIHTGADEQCAAILRVEKTVADALARFKGDERAGVAAGQLTLEGGVVIKDAGHDALAAGVGQELIAVAEEATGGD